MDLLEYNKFFQSDDENDGIDELPCSQLRSQTSSTQILASINPNILNNYDSGTSITSKIINKKVQAKEVHRDLPAHINSASDESSTSSISSNSTSYSYIMRSSPSTNQITQLDTQTEEENTQMKRMKFMQNIIDSTNPDPIKQIDLDDSLNFVNEKKEEEDCNFFGLSNKVKDLLKHLRGITSLYEWQSDLLTEMFEMEKIRNLLYLSPTSGGKTLVAEILLLQCLLLRKKNVIFVMPFVSIVQEKVEMLIPFGENLNFHVEEYAGLKGAVPPIKRRVKNSLYICTIEKAHSLINSLIETNRLEEEIGMVVADELHMIGDGPRGAIYEMILSKAKYCGKKSDLQIVATTATLENKKEIADFLDAHLFERDFRPVELKEYIKLDKQIFEIDKSLLKNCVENDFSFVNFYREINNANYTNEMKSNDPDGLLTLVNEIFDVTTEDSVKESCLIFCPSKKNCENVAQLLAKFLPSSFKQYKRDLKLKLFSELREQNGNNICPVLRQSLQFGIAYHHSGLTTEERQLIEAAYREGVLFLLTCTSTLAAGVNLPAKRVIIRAPHVGRDFISSHQYRQMIGRAGRAGYNTCGESILMFQNMDRYKVYDLVSGPMKSCVSSIEFDSKSIRILVLSLIGLDIVKHGYNLLEFFKETLFYAQKHERTRIKLSQENTQDIKDVPEEFVIFSHAITYLLENQFIDIKSESDKNKIELDLKQLYYAKYEISKLGLAAIKGGIDLEFARSLYNDLDKGLKTMVLSNYLHLLYLCTPYDLVNNLLHIDYDLYYRKFGNLSEDETKCAGIIGVTEDFINKKRFQKKILNKNLDENILKRFYMTLIIYELWKNNKSIWHVSNEFQLDRGFVQQIIQSSASFTSGVLHFCENIDVLWPYTNLLQELMKRLQYNCSQNELLTLMELDNVRQPRAQQLYNAGFINIEIIAQADEKDLAQKIKNLSYEAAKKLIKSANRYLEMKLDKPENEENLIKK